MKLACLGLELLVVFGLCLCYTAIYVTVPYATSMVGRCSNMPFDQNLLIFGPGSVSSFISLFLGLLQNLDVSFVEDNDTFSYKLCTLEALFQEKNII